MVGSTKLARCLAARFMMLKWASCIALISVNTVGAELPTTREAAWAIVERSKTDLNALDELKGASLEISLPALRELWTMGEYTTKNWIGSREAGREQEFFEMEASVHRDPHYLAKAYPIARDILMSHPDFEWTMQSKLDRMTYVLNAAEPILTGDLSNEYRDAHNGYQQELNFAARIPGDAAFRIIGPCLFSPYFPTSYDDDAPRRSSADRARNTLERILKERYSEDLPKDIEEARAWWKANEKRFAAKDTAATAASKVTASSASNGLTPVDPKSDVAARQGSDSQVAAETTSREIWWPISTAILSALVAAVVWFLLRKRI